MYLEEAKTIREMGFEDEVQIVGALRESRGSIEHAIQILTSKPLSEKTGKKRARMRKGSYDDNDYDAVIKADGIEEEKKEHVGKMPRITEKSSGPAKPAASKKERAHALKPTSARPLDGMTICVSGEMSVVRKHFNSELEAAGAQIAKTVTTNVTHLVTTDTEVANPTRKVLAAVKKKIPIVSEKFVRECLKRGSRVEEAEFILYKEGTASASGVKMIEEGKGNGAHAERIRDETWAIRASSKLLLAEKWNERIDPKDWWISEKLDGVRAFWSGRAFYSRSGNQFPAPDWFKEKMPNVELDGELWCGRRMFRTGLGIVRNPGSGKLWEYISFLVFDCPEFRDKVNSWSGPPFEQRMKRLEEITKDSSACIAVGMVKCEGRAHLENELQKVMSMGGEGLMLRQPGSKYAHGRSDTLLKVKKFQDEEAEVMRYQDGKGKYAGLVGALALRTPDGREFLCGSGLTDKDRKEPPPIGSVVTFRFTELMNNGYPRFPVFVARRTDIDWAKYCSEYSKPKKHNPILKRQKSILYGIKTPKIFSDKRSLSLIDEKQSKEKIEEAIKDTLPEGRAAFPPPKIEDLTEAKVKQMKLKQLKDSLKSLDLPLTGTREVLRSRLLEKASQDAAGWDSKSVMSWLQIQASDFHLKPETLVLLSQNEFDGPGFMSLTRGEIKEIGVTPLGQVKNVIRAVEALKTESALLFPG